MYQDKKTLTQGFSGLFSPLFHFVQNSPFFPEDIKRPFQVNSFISGSLQPEAEGSPAPDIIAYALLACVSTYPD